jgi:type IV pilus assembly protein PilA
MHCPACGNLVGAQAAFCHTCGHRLHGDVATRVAPRRPGIFTLLAIGQYVSGTFWLVLALMVFAAFRDVPETVRPSSVVFAAAVVVFLLGFCAVHYRCGVGLWKLKRYGWSLQRILASIGLLGFPLGTIISIIILIYLNTPGVRLLFSERSVTELTPEEYRQLLSTTQSSTARVAVVVVCLLLVGIFLTGIVAAVAIPGLLRARMASNESSAIATLRLFGAAQVSFAAANHGQFGSPECLSQPRSCLAGYSGPPFLSSPLERTFQKNGYLFQFFSAETTDPQHALEIGASRITRYALLAVPLTSQATGRRQFCVDASGTVSWSSEVIPPSVLPGRCPETWLALGPE